MDSGECKQAYVMSDSLLCRQHDGLSAARWPFGSTMAFRQYGGFSAARWTARRSARVAPDPKLRRRPLASRDAGGGLCSQGCGRRFFREGSRRRPLRARARIDGQKEPRRGRLFVPFVLTRRLTEGGNTWARNGLRTTGLRTTGFRMIGLCTVEFRGVTFRIAGCLAPATCAFLFAQMMVPATLFSI